MNNNSDTNQEDVVFTQNGEVYSPIDLDDNFLIITKFICCSIGIPLNLLIAITIIRHHRRLGCKPRNIFLLAIIFSYLLFYIAPLIELISWAFLPAVQSTESVCLVFIAVGGLPQALLLLNMILALVDRYVAINFPLLHREKMTVRLASAILLMAAISLIFLLKFVYIARMSPLRCEIWLVHSKVLAFTILLLFVSCILLNFIVYRKTRTLLGECRTLEIRNSGGIDGRVDELGSFETPGNESLRTVRSVGINNQRPMSIHVDKETLSQMEIEATRTLIFGVTSLVVTVCPIIILLLTFLVCRIIGQIDCSHFIWLATYFKELGLVHAIYNPLIFLTRNKELRSALTTRLINRGE
jgi:hypothetical protein